MGAGGLLRPTPRCSTTGTCRPRSSPAEAFDAPTWSRGRRTSRSSRGTCETHKLDARRRRRRARPAAPAGQRRRAGSRYVVADRPSPLYRNAIGDECVYVESGTAPVESVFGALEVGAGDYVIIPTSTIHRLVPTGDEPLRTLRDRGDRAHRPAASATCPSAGQFLEHSPYCERDLRGPSEPLLGRRRRTSRCCVQHRRGLDQVHLRPPPVRRGRLGRLPLPVRVLHPRLRADHRPAAPAAAGAPDLRGPELRDLLVRAAQGRLPPAGDPGAVQPRQRRLATRCSSTPAATSGAARAPASSRARSRCTRPASPTARSRARSRRRSARRLLRRAGRHGRHVPAAGPAASRHSPARTRPTPGPGPAATARPEGGGGGAGNLGR